MLFDVETLSVGALSEVILSSHLISTMPLLPLTFTDSTKTCEPCGESNLQSHFPLQFHELSQQHCERSLSWFPWLRDKRPEGPLGIQSPSYSQVSHSSTPPLVLRLSASLIGCVEREKGTLECICSTLRPLMLSLCVSLTVEFLLCICSGVFFLKNVVIESYSRVT